MLEISAENNFGFDFPACSFFKKFLNKLLINYRNHISKMVYNVIYFEIGGFKNF